jgi:MFS family permease
MTELVTASVSDGDGKARRNVAVLALAGALGGALPSINVASGPLAGSLLLGEDKSLATAPVTAFVVGTACGTVPAALLMRRVGRRPGFIAGMAIGAAACALQALAMFLGSMLVLCAGAFLTGFAAAFIQQFRFAAADTASPAFRPRAISYVLAGGIVAAVIGPQTVIFFADLLETAPFAGAYLGGTVLACAAIIVLLFLDIPKPPPRSSAANTRSVSEIARSPEFLVAVGCATSAYAIMSFVMTAAPLAMVMHDHARDTAILGIQWHVLAMFGPSFVTGSLIARFGAQRIVASGLVLLIGCALVALAGTSVGHFWLALVLLGIGWNFGFIGGTALITGMYRAEEKEKVQAFNDFLVFGFVALASYFSGEMLVAGGWNALNILVLPIAFACLVALLWQMSRKPRRQQA